MYCESELCVHNKNLSCNLDVISLDTRGMCYEYNYVSVQEELLSSLKEKHFRKLEEIVPLTDAVSRAENSANLSKYE